MLSLVVSCLVMVFFFFFFFFLYLLLSATLPGMQDRTLTVGSAGKTFSVTGWKVSKHWYSMTASCRSSMLFVNLVTSSKFLSGCVVDLFLLLHMHCVFVNSCAYVFVSSCDFARDGCVLR